MTALVLLDTNLWSYVADDEASDDLQRLGEDLDLEFLVAPTVVLEQLRVSDPQVRTRLLRVTTDERWTRTMPEAFHACNEIVSAVRLRRPEWTVERPSDAALHAFRENEQDWRGRFWSEARIEPVRRLRRTADLDDASSDLSLAGLREGRRVARKDSINLDDFHLTELGASPVPVNTRPGARRPAVWQYSSALHSADALYGPLADTTYHDWLRPHVDSTVARNIDDWVGFWMELNPTHTPVHWAWWAGASCAQCIRVNDGAPADINLTAYLTLPDIFVTADKRLHRVAEKIHHEAPFPVAAAFRATRDNWRDAIQNLTTVR